VCVMRNQSARRWFSGRGRSALAVLVAVGADTHETRRPEAAGDSAEGPASSDSFSREPRGAISARR
jgi:hypothetical protein